MRYFLGIDGGGTKTEALLCTECGLITGRGKTDSSNPLFIEKSAAFENIRKSIDLALKEYNSEMSLISAAVCIPGIKRYKEELKAQLLNKFSNAYIDADEMNAFLGAVAKPYGVVIVSGTGSFAMGVNRKGESNELGGWGPILGDEGSGYHIGLLCLKSIIREYEGAGPETVLTPKVMEFLQINNINELKRKVYSKEFDRSCMGSLGKIVKKAADESDAVSLEIIDSAAGELANLANRVIANLTMDDGTYDVVLTGGVRNFGKLIMKPFTEHIKRKNKNIIVKEPEFEPVIGSILIAMKDSGIDIMNEEILRNLHDSYKISGE